MKRIFLIFVALSFLGLITISVTAQPKPQTSVPRPTPTPLPRPVATPVASNVAVPQSKIALIDTGMFSDEKNGIYLYVDAARRVQLEFKPRTDELDNLANRLNALANEITKLRQAAVADQKTIQAKQAEGERLQQEATTKKERLDEDLAKRYEQVIAPISKQIGAVMEQFAQQRGITMTLDLSKLLPAILTAAPAIDLTQAFIDEFNRSHPRTSPGPRP